MSVLLASHPALVSRANLRDSDPATYLMLTPQGQADWTHDPATATTFESMREATRMAMRLPSALRAFSLLKDVEVSLAKAH